MTTSKDDAGTDAGLDNPGADRVHGGQTAAQIAHMYVQRYGWHLIPIPPGRKFPRAKDWGERAIKDPDVAQAYYEARPDYNMGVALGPSRVCSLDIDCETSFGIFCDAFGIDLAQLIADHPTVRGRGLRIMFSVPDGVLLPYCKLNWRRESDPTGEKHKDLLAQARAKKTEAEGLPYGHDRDVALATEELLREQAKQYAMYTVFELRASCDGQQRQDVLPPSVHPGTGRPYEWVTTPGAEIPPPPAWLLDIWTQFESTYRRQLQASCPWAQIDEIYKAERAQDVTPRQYVGDGGLVAVANEFSRRVQILEELQRQGYRIMGDQKRALSPYSGSGLPGVVIFKDSNKCWIHHASDPLCSDSSKRPVSAFDLRCDFEYGGKFTEAARGVAAEMGMRVDMPAHASAPAGSAVACAEDWMVSADGGGAMTHIGDVPAMQLGDDPAVRDAGSFDIAAPLPWITEKGKPLNNLDNLAEIMRRIGAVARYNLMTHAEELILPGAQFLQENESGDALTTLISHCSLFDFPTDKVPDFLRTLAGRNSYSPVVQWITSKPWDGDNRLPELYSTLVAEGDEQLKRLLIYRWMVSAVIAAFNPDGVSAQGVLILQGAQSLRKTTWLQRLVPDDVNRRARMFQDGMPLDPRNSDSVKQACSHWIVELGEMDGILAKVDDQSLKAWLGRDMDIMRLPYARRESRLPRRTVFVGSVNPRGFLKDPTGNRRYWVIRCLDVDADHGIDMQQVWAQVYHEWKAGARHWLDAAELAQLNDANEESTTICPIEERIQSAFAWATQDRTRWRWMTATDALIAAGMDRPSKADSTRAGSVIRNLNGGEGKRETSGARRRVLLVPPLNQTGYGGGY